MNNYRFIPYLQKGHKFLNPHLEDEKRGFLSFLLWKLGYFDDLSLKRTLPENFIFPLEQKDLKKDIPSVLWINHSTFLIQYKNLHILTDPIWSKRCSPFHFIGPRRKENPKLTIESLKKVDIVLISHNHYDHLDKETVQSLHRCYPKISWYVPIGVKKWLVKWGIQDQITEMSWWEESRFILKENQEISLTITAVPAQHFSGRTGFDFNLSLWAGWVIELTCNMETKRLYFAGDTGYNPYDFKAIGEKWGIMDLSLIPIGAYLPKKFMSPVHIDPFKAVEIHKDVNSRFSIAMHWNTFCLADEPMDQPPYDLFLALQKEQISFNDFVAVPTGYEVNW